MRAFSAALALVGLPAALKPGGEGIIERIAQGRFFSQCCCPSSSSGKISRLLLSDKRSESTFKDAEAILSEALEIQRHLKSQDDDLIYALKDAFIEGSDLPGAIVSATPNDLELVSFGSGKSMRAAPFARHGLDVLGKRKGLVCRHSIEVRRIIVITDLDSLLW